MRAPVIAAVALLASFMIRAQDGVPQPHLELRCPEPCKFQQGEPIMLELAFTASTPNSFRIVTNYNNRDMAPEQFTVTPGNGISDPLAPYIAHFKPVAGSFGFAIRTLSETPVVFALDLNEWARFDQPGAYKVSVESSRLRPAPASNEIVLELIKPDPQWQSDQLQRAMQGLDRLPRLKAEDLVHFQSVLGDLGTENAAREIVRRFTVSDMSGANSWVRYFEMALLRSPNRAAGLQEIDRLIADADGRIPERFLSAAGIVSVDPSAAREAINDLSTQHRQAYTRKLLEALPNKRTTARAVAAATLLKSRQLSASEEKRVSDLLAGN